MQLLCPPRATIEKALSNPKAFQVLAHEEMEKELMAYTFAQAISASRIIPLQMPQRLLYRDEYNKCPSRGRDSERMLMILHQCRGQYYVEFVTMHTCPRYRGGSSSACKVTKHLAWRVMRSLL